MTRKQERFIDEYLKDLNGTQAAIRAGYAERAARSQASTMLANPNILAVVNQKLEVLKQDAEADWMSPANIAKGFKNIHERCMQAQPVMRYDPAQRRMVQVTDEEDRAVWQFDSNGANRAWENIAKHIGFYELDNTQKAPVINIELTTNIALINQHDGANKIETPGNQNQLTDRSIPTVLPPFTTEPDTE